jgi:hypothetical protein
VKNPSRAKTCPAVTAKIFRFAIAPNHIYSFRHPGPQEGRIAIVTDVGHGMRWTHIAGRNSCATSGGCADGEIVWSWRSDAGAKLAKTLTRLADDGGNQAWSPGRSRISRKTIAQGGPEAGSSGRRNTGFFHLEQQLVKRLRGGFPSQCLSRSGIEGCCHWMIGHTCGSAACFFVARGPWVRAGTRPSLRPL